MQTSKITFTREQKNYLDEFIQQKTQEFVNKIMAEDDEDTSEEHLNSLAQEVFTTNSIKIGKAPKTKTHKTKSTGPKRPINAYLLWMKEEGREYIKNELGVTDNKAILAKAGEVWKSYQADKDSIYTKYNEIYQANVVTYKALIEGGGAAETVSIPVEPSVNEPSVNEPSVNEPTTVESSGGGKKSSKSKSKAKKEVEEESIETKTYDLSDFESFDGLTSNLCMFVKGGFTESNKKNKFDNLDDAIEAMNEDDEAQTIFLDKKGVYTLRKTQKMSKATDSQSPCIAWTKDDDSDADSD